ncbi:argininosuccinate lyase [Fructobacillus sp. M1-13]|uniref:Argininosuccinate lyase n=1 Tax=Fructobacillus papyriferae TaxID=2713171 RepID=A0ABS5QQK7_9LACO|nr:argininosuccinate lyase [Fructobacillus papyriferae]MBS9335451.1 argininosuccinate lyase [Fructobacillus papyriferae]MCD2159221.1 argininosuccinate lyase [Fructobacillus papyriferae]
MSNKLWGGRFHGQAADWVDDFGASIHLDYQLAAEDIEGSIAHATMLAKQGILTEEELEQIIAGLNEIREEILAQTFEVSVKNEDIHLNIEAKLTELIGPVAGKLHTARSRNDQVATDFHLWLKHRLPAVKEKIQGLQEALVNLAEDNVETLMPGYTHLQHAQPISYGHYLLAYFDMLERDYERFTFNEKHTDLMPLGAAALAGTTFPIDRSFVADELGFGQLYHNSLDAVSDRDFALEFLANAAILMAHLSRMAEEMILWTSFEFNYLELSDSFSTGSSIMPQKKNADFAELSRGKTGGVYGHLMGLLTVMKGLPLAYNKDMQEDKAGVFDSFETIMNVLQVFTGMIATMTVKKGNMRAALKGDYSNATELADYLVKKGMPFRQAHAVVGSLVYQGIEAGLPLEDMPLEELQKASELIDEEVYQVLKPETAVNARTSFGGTAMKNVEKELQRAQAILQAKA